MLNRAVAASISATKTNVHATFEMQHSEILTQTHTLIICSYTNMYVEIEVAKKGIIIIFS